LTKCAGTGSRRKPALAYGAFVPLYMTAIPLAVVGAYAVHMLRLAIGIRAFLFHTHIDEIKWPNEYKKMRFRKKNLNQYPLLVASLYICAVFLYISLLYFLAKHYILYVDLLGIHFIFGISLDLR
jgi:hypothetical protein